MAWNPSNAIVYLICLFSLPSELLLPTVKPSFSLLDASATIVLSTLTSLIEAISSGV